MNPDEIYNDDFSYFDEYCLDDPFEDTLNMRPFRLNRLKDISGVSGTGIVAEGVVLSDGQVVLHWLSKFGSINIYDSIEDMIEVHGHQGNTTIIYDKKPY